MSTSTINIKDYIVDVEASYKSAVGYSVLLENNTDFIILRTTAKTERELVILISQNLFYFKDRKGGMEPVTLGRLKTFLRDLHDGIPLNQVYWLSGIDAGCAEQIWGIISNDGYVDMCKHGVLKGILDPYWYLPLWEQNQKLFMQLSDLFPDLADVKKYANGLSLAFAIEKAYGYNEAMYFANQLILSSVSIFSSSKQSHSYYNTNMDGNTEGFMTIVANPEFNLNLRRFVDYVLFDLYAQGYGTIESGLWHEYSDYLRMQLQFYGRIDEKYPKHLKTEHDIIALKVNEMNALKECENFSAMAESVESLLYNGRDFSILVPKEPQNLVEEGISLNHCVGSYVGRVASGECVIMFLRRTACPDESLVTLQLSGKRIIQAQGMNRRPINKEERQFLLSWGRKMDVAIAV